MALAERDTGTQRGRKQHTIESKYEALWTDGTIEEGKWWEAMTALLGGCQSEADVRMAGTLADVAYQELMLRRGLAVLAKK